MVTGSLMSSKVAVMDTGTSPAMSIANFRVNPSPSIQTSKATSVVSKPTSSTPRPFSASGFSVSR